jgi:hypothetical protein
MKVRNEMKQKQIVKPEFPSNYYDENGELTIAALLYEIRSRRRKETKDEILLASSCHDEGGDNKRISEKVSGKLL